MIRMLPFAWLCLLTAPAAGHAQDFQPLRADGNGVSALTTTVSLDIDGVRLADAIASVGRQADLSLTLAADLPALRDTITLRMRDSAARVLLALVAGRPLTVRVSAAGDVVVAPLGEAAQTITGTILDAADGRPLSGADVGLAGRVVASDDVGAFRMPADAAGMLRVQRTGYHADSVRVRPGESAIVVRLAPAPTPLAAVVVTPGRFGALEETLAPRRTLSRAQIETAPQLGEDVFRAVTRLPGVASADVSAAFSIRGSAPREVLVMLDGLELYEPYHLKDFDGALSLIDVAAIGGVDLTTGGFTTLYGDRLAGVFDMRSAGRSSDTRTELALSITALRGLSSGHFDDGRGRWLASLRRGYLDLALALGGGNENLSPSYWDAFAKVEYAIGRQVVSAHVLHAGDDLHFEDGASDPVLDSRYGSTYGWVALRGPVGRALDHHTTASVGRLSWQRLGTSGPGPRADPLAIDDDRGLDFTGLRSDWNWAFSERALARMGVDVRALSASYVYDGWRAIPAIVDGHVVPVADSVHASLSPGATRIGLYVAQRVRPLDPLTIEAGVRWDRMGETGGVVQPRLNLAWTIGSDLTVRAAVGRYAQTQGLHEIAVSDGDTTRVRPERATQVVLGVERAFGAVDVRVEAYVRRVDDPAPYRANLDATTDVFPEFTTSRVRIDPDRGEARGMELLVSRAGPRWTWSASYALSKVTETVDGRVVPRARDQRHALAVDVAWSPAADWRLSSAWQVHTGWPRTRATVTLDDDAWAAGEYLLRTTFGPYNAARLPPYHRLDVRVTRQFRTARGRVSMFLDLFNAYGRENPRALIPSIAIRDGQVVPIEDVETFLPRLPSLGVIWTF